MNQAGLLSFSLVIQLDSKRIQEVHLQTPFVSTCSTGQTSRITTIRKVRVTNHRIWSTTQPISPISKPRCSGFKCLWASVNTSWTLPSWQGIWCNPKNHILHSDMGYTVQLRPQLGTGKLPPKNTGLLTILYLSNVEKHVKQVSHGMSWSWFSKRNWFFCTFSSGFLACFYMFFLSFSRAIALWKSPFRSFRSPGIGHENHLATNFTNAVVKEPAQFMMCCSATKRPWIQKIGKQQASKGHVFLLMTYPCMTYKYQTRLIQSGHKPLSRIVPPGWKVLRSSVGQQKLWHSFGNQKMVDDFTHANSFSQCTWKHTFPQFWLKHSLFHRN